MAPKIFGETALAETPTTNPKSLTGRNIEVSLSDLFGDYSKDQYRLTFKVTDITEKTAHTKFQGFSTLREFLMRMTRKRAQKVEVIQRIMTKDRWSLQVALFILLNRNTESSVQKKVRNFMAKRMEDFGAKTTVDELVKSVVAGNFQKNMKKAGSKIYPVRFFEISRIKVLKPPEG